MICLGTRQNGDIKRRPIPVLDDIYYKSEWMASGENPLLSPTVSLIEQPPGAILVPHFHRQNQFQLFVDGGGVIGTSDLKPMTIHYAGAYTGYGPLVAGSTGIKYFTIRSVCETGLVPISEAREKMVRGPKRHAQSGPLKIVDGSDLLALDEVSVEASIPLSDDGLGAEVACIPAASPFKLVRQTASEGVFVFVLAGALAFGETQLQPWESIFVSAEETEPDLAAGKNGAQILVLHVPRKASAYL